MTIQENWALPMARIEAYLQGLDGARRISQTRYQGGGCEICLQMQEESKVGRYAVPRKLVNE